MKENSTNKKIEKHDIAAEYDFSGGTRGVYVVKHAHGSNIVALEPDAFEVFHGSRAVNEALRSLMKSTRQSVDKENSAYLVRENQD